MCDLTGVHTKRCEISMGRFFKVFLANLSSVNLFDMTKISKD